MDLGADVTICDGDSTTLTATGGDTYLWSTGGTSQDITGLIAGTYTVTITDDSLCSLVTSIVINGG